MQSIHLGMSGSFRILPEELPLISNRPCGFGDEQWQSAGVTPIPRRRFGARLWTKELEGHNVLAILDPGAA